MSGCSFITLRLTEWKRGGNVQSNAALIFAAVCFSYCSYCEGPKNNRVSSCNVLKSVAEKVRAAALERGRVFVDRGIIAFLSYESGNCVINSSVTFDQVLVSSALTGASLNVFDLKSEAKKSINMNTSYRACILKPSAEHLLTNHSADICRSTLESLLGCICPEK